MSDYVTVLALAALPAVANVGGGLLAEVLVIRRRTINLVFQWVAGMLLGVVGIELMPRALRATHPWLVVLAFILGGGFFLLLEEEILPKEKSRHGRDHRPSVGVVLGHSGRFVYYRVVIGAGVTVERKLGVLLAVSLLVVDAPEGFLTIANLRSHGVAVTTRLALLATLGFSVF
jgi:ZIP family zinc transporter